MPVALGQTSTVDCALEAAVFKSHRFGVICAMAVAVSSLASVTEPDQRVPITARNARGEHLAQRSSKYQALGHDIVEYEGTWLVVQPDGEPAPH